MGLHGPSGREEAHIQLGVPINDGCLGVFGCDRSIGGDVPGGLPVRLQKVGVAARGGDDRIDGAVLEMDTALFGGDC